MELQEANSNGQIFVHEHNFVLLQRVQRRRLFRRAFRLLLPPKRLPRLLLSGAGHGSPLPEVGSNLHVRQLSQADFFPPDIHVRLVHLNLRDRRGIPLRRDVQGAISGDDNILRLLRPAPGAPVPLLQLRRPGNFQVSQPEPHRLPLESETHGRGRVKGQTRNGHRDIRASVRVSVENLFLLRPHDRLQHHIHFPDNAPLRRVFLRQG